MKQMHQCEKCGKVFTGPDSFREAYDCEGSHKVPERICDNLQDRFTYKEGQTWPDTLILQGPDVHDELNEIHYPSLYLTYKLVGPLKQSETDEINAKIIEADKANKRWWAEYNAKQAAEKAAKEAEKAAEAAQ